MHRGRLSDSEHRVYVHLGASRTNSDLSLRSLADLYTTLLFDALIILDGFQELVLEKADLEGRSMLLLGRIRISNILYCSAFVDPG
jgi:hypothetical protein